MRMNKTSRLLAVLLALLLALGSAPAALADGLVISSEQYAELSDAAVQEFYDRLMATTTLEEFDAVASELTEAQGLSFMEKLSEEQEALLKDKANQLLTEYENAAEGIVSNESAAGSEEEVTDEREIEYPTVNYTNVAPFKDPVVGTAPMVRMMLMAASEEETDNGLEVDKYISKPDDNGQYTLTLEAWATGAKVTTTQETSVPTDIILVLDQSGSMDDGFTSTSYRTTSGTPEELYENRNSLYVQLENGAYSPVSVTKTSVTTGTSYTAYSGQTNSTYYSNRDNLYHLCSEGTYGKVTVDYETSGWISRTYYYTYTCGNGCTLGSDIEGRNTTPSFDDSLYQLTATTVDQYTFSYEKADGTTETATVMETDSAPAWNFYESYASGNTTRLAALKSAVTTFANSVATKAKGADGTLGTDDDVKHRIAVVGFASGQRYNGRDYNYGNTEVFVGSDQYTYGTSASNQYTNVLQDMSTTSGVNNVTASISALDADGGTIINLGMEMAAGILEANPVLNGEKRNRVVVVFTDGIPGWSGYDSDVADSAIAESNTIKSTYGATVYTVGIFSGADATSAGSSSGNETQKANYFMQRLSSNTSYPQTPSYYLSASDANALNNIFKQISENIESGGSSITLDETAVVKDVLTEQFVLPEGTAKEDIKVYTADYTAADTFADPVEFTAAVPNISEDGKTISVTNFDFAENWVGTETAADGTVTYRGKKLIIEIPIEVRDGFLGGNGVVTNAEGSGVYENASAEEALDEFVSPTVDVAIGEVTVTAPDKNVYLLGDVTKAELEAALTVKVGDVALDMDAANYGLAEWQYAYVNLSDEDGTADYSDLKEDQSYTVSVTVTPKTEGTATKKESGDVTGHINVFKPVLTFKDSEEKYFSTRTEANADTYYDGNNLVSEVWKHDDTLSTATGVTMTGAKPTLALTYTPSYAEGDNALFDSMKVVAKNDVKVNVAVAIGATDVTAHTTSIRSACTCTELDTPCAHKTEVTAEKMGNDPEFIVHVYDVYGHLAITKKVEGTPATGVATNFTFKVEVSVTGAFNYTITDAEGETVAVTDAEGNVVENTTISNGGTITLADGQTATISDLPPEATYTVTETVPAGYVSSTNPVTGSIVAGSTMEANFTNTYTTGSLTVIKKVVGTDAPADDEFKFTVTLNPAISGTFSDVTFTDGVATITMKGGASTTITGLPINATYTVTEKEYADYTTTKNGDTGTISTTGSTAEFTNTYKYGSLTITKEFNGCTPQEGETFLFTVTGPNSFSMNVVIAGEGSTTIEHLPLGTYTVTEDNAWSWRYTSNPTSASDEIKATENGSVTFTNSLTENKWLDGNAYAENNFNGVNPNPTANSDAE